MSWSVRLWILVCVMGIEVVALGIFVGRGYESVLMSAWSERDDRCWRWVNATGQRLMGDEYDGGENYSDELKMCQRVGIIKADEGGVW